MIVLETNDVERFGPAEHCQPITRRSVVAQKQALHLVINKRCFLLFANLSQTTAVVDEVVEGKVR